MDLDICRIVFNGHKNEAARISSVVYCAEPLTMTLKMRRYLKTRVQDHGRPKQLLLELLQFLDIRESHSKVCHRPSLELPSNLELREPCLFGLFEHKLSKADLLGIGHLFQSI